MSGIANTTITAAPTLPAEIIAVIVAGSIAGLILFFLGMYCLCARTDKERGARVT